MAKEIAGIQLGQDMGDDASIRTGEPFDKIAAVRLPGRLASSLWDVSIKEGRIVSVDPHEVDLKPEKNTKRVLDGSNRFLAPSLCHCHIHIDKCFLLQDPKYSDLQIEKGDFQEAMDLTGRAKARFTEDDLLRRGRQLVEESIIHGVTAMRAFVEVDETVQFKCLDAGLKLRAEFEDRCEIQLCAFAQLPLFSGKDGGEEARNLMTKAAQVKGIDVLGSTPYVEQDDEKQKKNLHWITSLALTHGKHLDLHLDYFLEEHKHPLIWTALEVFKESWKRKQHRQITLGHCTRLTRFNDDQWTSLKQYINDLPISFIGLPTSDLFIMRTAEGVRGTLPIVEMIRRHGLAAAIAVNNVGNAFTPQGNCDPLSIASIGVGIYQAGTRQDTDILYEAVSSRAKTAIGCEATSLALKVGEPADFVLFDNSMGTDWRCRKSISEVVYDAGSNRMTIRRGRLTSYKKNT